ncbi:transposase [Holospora elegans]
MPRSVLVMDNGTFHKGEKMKEDLGKDGHELFYLPPYCFPDLNSH